MHSFIKIFPSPSFVDVLTYFVLHSAENLYISSLVEGTGAALMQVQRAIKRLEAAGLIIKEKCGKKTYYHTNRNHPALENIKHALVKTVVFDKVLQNVIKPIKKKLLYGFIYGSFANGKEQPTSDIDIFLIGNLTMQEVARILGPITRKFERECNVALYSIKEIREKLKEENPFIIHVLKNPKIWFLGDENEFKKMVS